MKRKMMMSNLNKKKMINFEIVTMTNENEMMIKKKISIENNDFQMFKIFDVKNSIKRISAKLVINDITSFLNIFENLLFNFEKILKMKKRNDDKIDMYISFLCSTFI